MSRLQQVSVEQSTGQTADLYKTIKSQLGSVPQIFQALGTAPKVLENYFNMGAAQSSLSGGEKESIALAVAQINSCNYCLAAHTALGKMAKLSDDDMLRARKGQVNDPKRKALLKLATEITTERGHVSDQALSDFRAAGYTDAQVPEVVLAVVQNIFTNYFNHVNQTEVDFPAAVKI
jgi:uncharacterized peroxidase-related enzyme